MVISTAFAVLVLAACTHATTGERGTEVGSRPLSFVLSGLTAGPGDVAISNGRPKVINLWATWCPPCREELPLLNAFARRGVQIVGVDEGEDAAQVRAAVDRAKVSYPMYLDRDQQFGAAYATIGLPTTIVLNGHGRISAVHQGEYTAASLARDLQTAAKE